MDFEHIKYFIAAAEMQNYTKAADKLFITPSALSKAIKTLEQETGLPLFERAGRNISLTSYGKSFYKVCVETMETLNSGIRTIQYELQPDSGIVNLAGIYTMCANYLPWKIKEFKDLYPKVEFSIEYMITSEIIEAIINDEYELGFCGDFELCPEKNNMIEKMLIKIEELVIIVPKNHRLAQEEYVSFNQLGNEDFITYKKVASGIDIIFKKFCRENGFEPKISFEVPDDHSIVGLVSAGLGIALVADNFSLRSKLVSKVKIKPIAPTRNQYIIWKKDKFLSPICHKFRKFIIDRGMEKGN